MLCEIKKFMSRPYNIRAINAYLSEKEKSISSSICRVHSPTLSQLYFLVVVWEL